MACEVEMAVVYDDGRGMVYILFLSFLLGMMQAYYQHWMLDIEVATAFTLALETRFGHSLLDGFYFWICVAAAAFEAFVVSTSGVDSHL